jgi:hypothetical protein
MSRAMQDIAVVDYDGPQGSKELSTVESASINRTKPKSRVKTMNRSRRAIGMQTGTEEVSISLTVVPELENTEVNWLQAWKDDEEFTLTIEKGIDGTREQIQDCQVSDVNDSFSESGEARQEISIEGISAIEEP